MTGIPDRRSGTVDVEELQRAIERAAVESGPEPPFPQLQLDMLRPALAHSVRVEPHPPLIGRTTYEKVWAAINRRVRRVAGLAVVPVVEQQNEANARLLRSLDRLAAVEAGLHAAIVRMRAERHDGQA